MEKLNRLPLILLLILNFSYLTAQSSINDVYREGEDFRLMGEYYRAVESYKTALQMNPSYLGPLKGLASSYFALGEYSEALYWVSEAIKYDRNNLELYNLQGRINLGLGNFNEAAELFQIVLSKEPYNMDAQFGMAELEIARGKMRNAAERYTSALRISPENRRALLSLVLLYNKLGNTGAAEDYIEQALYFYSDNPQVRYIAGYHYMSLGDYDKAFTHAEAALALDPGYLDAGILYSRLAISTGKDREAVKIMNGFLGENRDQPLLWYSLGTAYRNLDMIENAVQSFAAASNLRSGDDMSRITLENLIMDKLELDDPRRDKYAAYHFNLGEEYDTRNLLKRAYQEFRRGMMIAPYSIEGRSLLAGIYKRYGHLSRYREELNIIDSMLEEKDVDISDELEFLNYRLADSVASEWDIDQFYVDREKNSLAVFYMESDMYHINGEDDLMTYIKSILSGYENIELVQLPARIDSFAQGYRAARESDSDYFLIIDIEESERIISLKNRIFMSETGGELKSWSIFRTGNQRIPDAVLKLSSDIHTLMPVSGRLIDRSFDDALISLGLVDGYQPGDNFLVIRNGEMNYSKDGFGYQFDPSSILGVFTVTALDDFICQGTLEKHNFF